MKVVGLIRVRDEELLLEDSLSSMLEFCDQVILLDDCSTDRTAEIAEQLFVGRVDVIHNSVWDRDRQRAETADRRRLLDHARAHNPDWLVYMDADERLPAAVRQELESLPASVHGVRFRLLDAYLTQEFHSPYLDGRLIDTPRLFGPEFRSILMAWRASAPFHYVGRDQREPVPGFGSRVAEGTARVRHYGKAISIDEWERTCDYYSTHFPEPYRSRWLSRKGKALHTRSVEGRGLCPWPIATSFEVPLNVAAPAGLRFHFRRAQVSVRFWRDRCVTAFKNRRTRLS